MIIYGYWIIIIIIIVWPRRFWPWPWPWPGPGPGPDPGPDWLRVGGNVLGGLAGGFLLNKGLGIPDMPGFSEAILSGVPVLASALLGGGAIGKLPNSAKQ